MEEKTYLCIDLKSFYASVECVERGLNPLTTNLVVADNSRTEKTICLAVSPSLKAIGIPGRPRLFEVIQRVRLENTKRLRFAPGGRLTGRSVHADELEKHGELAIDYLVAKPRMAHYIQYSTRIYACYLKYVAPEDIHVYSIDEVFMDITKYLPLHGMSAHAFAMLLIREVLQTTGITATAGIGTNLYLAKIAMDIMAKHQAADKDGVRIAQLDMASYRRQLWDHRPLTDFWRVGKGYAKKLAQHGLYTMGDIARCSLGAKHCYHNPGLLYKILGVNAELLIDHAWGWEPCTLKEIKAYRPASKSVGSGQVLHEPYSFTQARLVVQEMVDQLALDLLRQDLTTDQLVLEVHYERLEGQPRDYLGRVVLDSYGRTSPQPAHGSINLPQATCSSRLLVEYMLRLYDRIVQPQLLIRKLNLAANHVLSGEQRGPVLQEFDLFADQEEQEQRQLWEQKEKKMQQALLQIKGKYGKNAILKGMNFLEKATAKERNEQIGGHKA